MQRLTLDTSCVIAAVQREPEATAVDALIDKARAGLLELWLTTAFTYDQDAASDRYRKRNLAWLRHSAILGTVPGPFRFDLSQFDGPDVFTTGRFTAIDKKIRMIVGKGKKSLPVQDVHHLAAHAMAGHDVFVTLDQDDILRVRDVLRRELGITALCPTDALKRIDAPT